MPDTPHRRPFWWKHISKPLSRDLLLYFICVIISFVFWLFLSLHNDSQRDYQVPLSLEGVPDSVVVIGNLPSSVSVVVQGRGLQFLKFRSGSMKPLRLYFREVCDSRSNISVSKAKLEMLLREYFGQGVRIVNLRPDSVYVPATNRPGRKVPLHIKATLQPASQYVATGKVYANVDSVTLYSVTPIPATMTYVSTASVVRTGLKDTTALNVRVQVPPGVRAIPDVVKLTVPIEPLIAKKRIVPIEVKEAPQGVRLTTFPRTVEISYLVPMSEYSSDAPVNITVDFNEINRSTSHVKVHASSVPVQYKKFTLKPDSVEYIIETLQ